MTDKLNKRKTRQLTHRVTVPGAQDPVIAKNRFEDFKVSLLSSCTTVSNVKVLGKLIQTSTVPATLTTRMENSAKQFHCIFCWGIGGSLLLHGFGLTHLL